MNRLCGGIISTKTKKETRVEIITKSFKGHHFIRKSIGRSVESWTWDKVRSQYQHPIGKIAAFRQLFNVGPVAGS
jgi:penicillin amidase